MYSFRGNAVRQLVGERLLLRALSEQDVSDTYVSWLNDVRVNRYLEIRHATHSLESCRQFVMAMNESSVDHLFGIFLQGSGQHIGNVKLGFIDRFYGKAQLSLFIGERSAWGQGYGTEVISLVTTHGFLSLGLSKIEAGCYDENMGSLRAFLKSGYSVEGFSRKSVVLDGRRMGCFLLGALADEWRSASI